MTYKYLIKVLAVMGLGSIGSAALLVGLKHHYHGIRAWEITLGIILVWAAFSLAFVRE